MQTAAATMHIRTITAAVIVTNTPIISYTIFLLKG